MAKKEEKASAAVDPKVETGKAMDAFDKIFGDDKNQFQIASSEGWRFWAAAPGEVIVGCLLRGSYGHEIKFSKDATFYEIETTAPCRVFTEDMEGTEVVPAGTIVSVFEKAGLRKLRPYADHPKYLFEVAVRCGDKVDFTAKDGGEQSVWRYDIRGRLTDRPKPIAEGDFLSRLEGGREPWDRDAGQILEEGRRSALPEGARA